MELEGKKVLVVGLARSGVAAARLLARRGAQVTANDTKPEPDISDEARELSNIGVRISLGGHPLELFTGADLIVLSPGVPADIEPLASARSRGAKIISEAELAFRFLKGQLIGVTGSNGKTTTTTLIGELMKASGARTLVGGNIGTALTSLVDQTTEDSWLVAELSSFQLETIEALRPRVAVITNITPDHLDRHGSFENYARAKHRLFINQTAEDWAVINGSDSGSLGLIALGIPSRKAFFSARHAQATGVYGREGKIFTTLLEDSQTEVISFDEIPLPGLHNIENVCAALASVLCALGKDAPLDEIREAIRGFKGVEHRIEFVAEISGVKFYNDSKATNIDSTIKALESFAGNIILILGGKDKGGDFTLLAPLVRERVKRLVLIGAASDKIASQLADAQPVSRASTMREAVAKSVEAASTGDTVLLAPACASFDMFNDYEHRGRVFKEEVQALKSRV
jgi:UDP-N-acetylmuramoylalanine--D-glutamate ligase